MGLLVSFSGIDGAGKSTQIAALISELERAGQSVSLFSFWDDAATLKRFREDVGHKVFKGDKGVGSPETPIERRDKNVRSPLLTFVRLGIYLLDAISLARLVRRKQKARGAVIFDRYLYDELANLDLAAPPFVLYARLLVAIVPRPDVSLILDADPVKAFARKPEYPLDFLHKNRESYLTLARVLGKMTVIPALSVDQVKEHVRAAVFSRRPSTSR